jgi:hypothetical protein
VRKRYCVLPHKHITLWQLSGMFLLGSQLGLEDSRKLFNCWWNSMQVEEDEAVTENSEEEKVADEAKPEVFTGSVLYFIICGMPY